MKRMSILFCLALIASACDHNNVAGTGVVEQLSNVDFSGVVLHDSVSGELYDLSEISADEKQEGMMVEYIGAVDPTYAAIGGGPTKKLIFSKYTAVGQD